MQRKDTIGRRLQMLVASNQTFLFLNQYCTTTQNIITLYRVIMLINSHLQLNSYYIAYVKQYCIRLSKKYIFFKNMSSIILHSNQLCMKLYNVEFVYNAQKALEA